MPKYHRARTLVACTAALILLWWLGVKFEGPLPLLGVHVKELDKHAYILGVILFYAIVRLLIEWFQSDPWRRRRYASRIDLGLTLVVASGAGWLLADKLLPIVPLPSLPSLSFFVSAITLVGLGIAAGEFVKVLLFSLYFIRSSEEARRLGLPRVPVAVRATFRAVWVIWCPGFTDDPMARKSRGGYGLRDCARLLTSMMPSTKLVAGIDKLRTPPPLFS